MNFLINNKIWLIVIAGFLGMVLAFGIEIWRLKGDISIAQTELKSAQFEAAIREANLQISISNLNECRAKIDLQNEAIKRARAQKQDIKKTKEKVDAKFERIKPPDSTCESKLNFYEDVLNEAND